MKPIANHGDAGLPEEGGQGKAVGAKSREEFIIVPMEDDFDIDAVFRSEESPAADAQAEAPPEPIDVSAAAPDPEPPPDVIPTEPDEQRLEPARPIQVVPEPAAASLISLTEPRTSEPLVLAPSPALVIEMPLRAEMTRSDRVKTPALSIADLIDNHVRLEWHEAVAIAQHLCQVMSRDPGANVRRSLVEPWNVEITDSGDVQVLPGGSSSDPLVKQVGRVLRVLLQDSLAPAELRLVASQASFEVPVYSSVDELSAALRHFERPGDSESAIRAAFNRGLEAKFAALPAPERTAPPPAPRPAAVELHPPVKPRPVRKTPELARPKPAPKKSGVGIVVAGLVVLALAAAAVVLIVRLTDFPNLRSTTTTAPAPAPRTETPVARAQPTTPETRVAPPVPAPPPATTRDAVPERGAPAASRRPASRPRGPAEPEGLPATPVAIAPRVESVPRPAATGDSTEASIRRASALLAEGRDGEAAVIFDGIVMRSPLYQLDPVRSTPEALAAFQKSKRMLLPAMARRYYQEARMAYDAGDFSMASTKGERALALLRDADIDPSEADLNGEVSNLMATVAAARTLEEARVYTSADKDVTPPRPVGRQLSTASLSGKGPLTGRLELVVGRGGEVETVRLETPLNGYHDRMIVSAAKAWHYRPALRKGRPVRYSMVMSITLPDF